MQRPGKETLPGDRLCKATLKTSMQVNAEATLVEVATAGMMPPASTFALNFAGEESVSGLVRAYNAEAAAYSHMAGVMWNIRAFKFAHAAMKST